MLNCYQTVVYLFWYGYVLSDLRQIWLWIVCIQITSLTIILLTVSLLFAVLSGLWVQCDVLCQNWSWCWWKTLSYAACCCSQDSQFGSVCYIYSSVKYAANLTVFITFSQIVLSGYFLVFSDTAQYIDWYYWVDILVCVCNTLTLTMKFLWWFKWKVKNVEDVKMLIAGVVILRCCWWLYVCRLQKKDNVSVNTGNK